MVFKDRAACPTHGFLLPCFPLPPAVSNRRGRIFYSSPLSKSTSILRPRGLSKSSAPPSGFRCFFRGGAASTASPLPASTRTSLTSPTVPPVRLLPGFSSVGARLLLRCRVSCQLASLTAVFRSFQLPAPELVPRQCAGFGAGGAASITATSRVNNLRRPFSSPWIALGFEKPA